MYVVYAFKEYTFYVIAVECVEYIYCSVKGFVKYWTMG